jgi:hypothetical protein
MVEQILTLQFQHQVSGAMAERIILAKARAGERTGNIKAVVRWTNKYISSCHTILNTVN